VRELAEAGATVVDVEWEPAGGRAGNMSRAGLAPARVEVAMQFARTGGQ
jgi:hypothetical protein